MTRHADAARLRGHHLICLHFYRGEGYGPGFIDNLSRVVARAEAGSVTVVAGADDVCAACTGLRAGICEYRPGMEEEVGRLDAMALELLGMKAGDTLGFATLEERLPDVLGEWRTDACAGCEWIGTCAPRMPGTS